MRNEQIRYTPEYVPTQKTELRRISSKIAKAFFLYLILIIFLDALSEFNVVFSIILAGSMVFSGLFWLISQKYPKICVYSFVVLSSVFCSFAILHKISDTFAVIPSILVHICLIFLVYMSIKFKKPLLLMVCFLEFSIISCEIVGLNYEKSTKGIANADAISFYTLHNLAEIAASVLPFLFILSKKDALLKLDISRVLCFEKVKRKKLFSLVMVGLFICFFANQVSNVLLQNLSLLGITCKLPNLPEVNKDPVRIVLYLIMISVSPALVEEFVFRGVILGSLRKFGNFFAIISSSILFGVVHSNAVQIPFAFVVGLILGMILVETNSMLPGILIHFLNNLFSCLDSIISEYNEEISQEFMTFRWMTVLILSIFAFRYILSIRPTLFEFDRNSHALFSTKKSMKIFFLSKGMIVVLLIFFLFTLSTVSLA